MQVIPPDRARVGTEIGAKLGEREKPVYRIPSSSFTGQLFLQQLSYQRVDGGIVFRGINLGLSHKIGRKVECDVTAVHINKCHTRKCDSLQFRGALAHIARELRVEAADIPPDGFPADAERLRDLPVAQTLLKQFQNIRLAAGQVNAVPARS